MCGGMAWHGLVCAVGHVVWHGMCAAASCLVAWCGEVCGVLWCVVWL